MRSDLTLFPKLDQCRILALITRDRVLILVILNVFLHVVHLFPGKRFSLKSDTKRLLCLFILSNRIVYSLEVRWNIVIHIREHLGPFWLQSLFSLTKCFQNLKMGRKKYVYFQRIY